MNVLLLAAGMGTRLKDMTTALPKSLLTIEDKPILSHIFESLSAVPFINKVTVVTGFERERITSFLEGLETRLTINEIWNEDFRKGNLYSVETGLHQMTAPFFITNADHIFPSALLSKAFEKTQGVSAVCDFDRPLTPDCMKILLDENTKNSKVKEIHKKLEKFNAGYIGMTSVAKDGLSSYMSAFEKVRSRGEENAYAEQVLQELATTNQAPNIIDASGFGWLEVDTSEDLDIARETFQKFPRFIQHGRR